MQPRNKWVHFVMSQDELDRMQQKMQEVGIQNKSAYLRKMALDGYCVNLELEDVKKMVSLLRYCSNNLNQYAWALAAIVFGFAVLVFLAILFAEIISLGLETLTGLLSKFIFS